nr:reverse transcriptase domain-containing protein [Tanacetum cinerariifolium]
MTNYRYWLQITSSSWSFVYEILGQMTYLVADSTSDCARSWISLMECSASAIVVVYVSRAAAILSATSFLMAAQDMVDASDHKPNGFINSDSTIHDIYVYSTNTPEEDVEPKQIILDPDDQPMWESAKTIIPTPTSAIIQLDVDDNFVINTTHLNMIRENKFDGYMRADPHDHIREFLAICNIFRYETIIKPLVFYLTKSLNPLVKDKQEKDKIETKPDKNGKHGKARQCRSPVTVKKAKQEKKIQVKGTKNGNPERCIMIKKTTRTDIAIILKKNNKGQICQTVKDLMEQLTSMCEMVGQFIQKKEEEKKIEEDQAANARYWKIPACGDDGDDYNFAITPDEPVDSLIMGDEHHNTIPTMKSDEFIMSSVENLVPNPSESEGESKCDVPTREEFTTFSNVLFDADYEFDSSDDQSLYDEDVPEKIFSNPLFEEEIIPMKIDQHYDNAESDLVESPRTHDSSLTISSKIDSLLDEFAGELTLLKSIPLGINETDCDLENEIRLTKRLLYDNSSPHPLEEFVSENSNADIESFSPSPISVEDSDSFMEEIDLSFTPDDPMTLGIEEDDYDSERDILIFEELLDNYSLSLPKNESFHFDIPSFSRPPAKPPDGNTRILNIKMMGDISEQKPSAECPMMIHGKNTPILDVPLFHFYPLDQFNRGGEGLCRVLAGNPGRDEQYSFKVVQDNRFLWLGKNGHWVLYGPCKFGPCWLD